MSETPNPLGIIAGNRTLPIVLAREARAQGIPRITAVAFEGETDPALASLVDEIEWMRVGQLSKMIKAFKKQGVKYCVMAGQLAPKSLFDVRPDLRGVTMLLRLKEKNAHTVFGAIADELLKDGIELISAVPWLKPVMPAGHFVLGKKLSADQLSDVEFGLKQAKEISALEIGQSVVVKDGVVLAVEAFEGTDKCLARGGQLAGKHRGGVAVKVAKEGHDMRFDIPCVGTRTIETCLENGVDVLAFEGGKTLLLDEEEVKSLVSRNKFTLMSV